MEAACCYCCYCFVVVVIAVGVAVAVIAVVVAVVAYMTDHKNHCHPVCYIIPLIYYFVKSLLSEFKCLRIQSYFRALNAAR